MAERQLRKRALNKPDHEHEAERLIALAEKHRKPREVTQ